MPFRSIAAAALTAFALAGALAAANASARVPLAGSAPRAGPPGWVADSTAGAAKSGVTGDLTDVWWPNAESGWGIQFVHNADYVFATMYVYNATGQPTFYVGSLQNTPVGSNVWTGPLSSTTGPYFGAPFDPAAVVETVVGSMRFEVDSRCWCEGTLTYNVGAVQVTKFIDRQPLRLESFSGAFLGRFRTHLVIGACVAEEFPDDPVVVQFDQTGTAATVLLVGIRSTTPSITCGAFATYSQTGRLGRFEGTLACPSGHVGQLRLGEITRGEMWFAGNWSVEWGSGCSVFGSFVAN